MGKTSRSADTILQQRIIITVINNVCAHQSPLSQEDSHTLLPVMELRDCLEQHSLDQYVGGSEDQCSPDNKAR